MVSINRIDFESMDRNTFKALNDWLWKTKVFYADCSGPYYRPEVVHISEGIVEVERSHNGYKVENAEYKVNIPPPQIVIDWLRLREEARRD